MSAFHTMKDERDALEEKVEELEREVRLMRQQYFRRLEERDALKAENADLKAGMKSLQHLFSQRRSARSMVELAQQCVDLRVAKTEEGE